MTNNKKRSVFIILSFAEIIFSVLACASLILLLYVDFPPFRLYHNVYDVTLMVSMVIAFVLACVLFALNMRYKLIPLSVMSVVFGMQIIYPAFTMFMHSGILMQAITVAVQILFLVFLIKMIRKGTEISEDAAFKNVNDKKKFSLALYIIQAVPASISILSLFESCWEELVSPNEFSSLYNFYHTMGYNFKDQTLLHGILRKTDFYLGGQWDSTRLEFCMVISFVCVLILIAGTRNQIFTNKQKALLAAPYIVPVIAVIFLAVATNPTSLPTEDNPIIKIIFNIVIIADSLLMTAVQIFMLCKIIKLFKKCKSHKAIFS